MTSDDAQPRRPPRPTARPRPSISAFGQGPRHRPRVAAVRRRAAEDRRLLAGEQLPRPRDDVPEGEPAAEGAAQARARQGPAARPLGRQPRPGVLLHPPEPGDQGTRPRRGLHGRAGARGAGRARAVLPGRVVLRGLPGLQRGRGGAAAALQAVLLPRRDRQPLHARRRPARSTRAANSATSCPTPAGPRSTTRT